MCKGKKRREQKEENSSSAPNEHTGIHIASVLVGQYANKINKISHSEAKVPA
jgi:hypothetical protein